METVMNKKMMFAVFAVIVIAVSVAQARRGRPVVSSGVTPLSAYKGQI